jgi:membrane-associated phospholipid phosphatase
VRRTELLAWVRRRLTPGEYFGLELTLGAAAFVAAAWLFGGLAEDVTTGEPITRLDEQIANWFHSHETAGVRTFMADVSGLHTWPIAVLAAGFLAYLLWRHEWSWAVFGSCAVLGGMGLNTLLKLAFHRERPTLSGFSSALHSYSFPSGHALAATVIYGVLAAYAVRRVRNAAARTAIVGAAILMIALVAFSRLYLGVHYLSDVLAAMAEGTAWLALCYTAAHTLMARRRRRDGK